LVATISCDRVPRVTIALLAVERAVFINQSKVVADRRLTQAQVLRELPDGHRLSFAVRLSVESVALADMRCSADTRLCTGHHEDHGLGDRHGVISESFVIAAEQGDVDRCFHAVRPVV
jgi:hypothetical protein